MSKFLPTTLTTSPHLKRHIDVSVIMRNVVWALLPVVAMAVYTFGVSALAVIVTTTAGCVLTEYLYNFLCGRHQTLQDYSAIITGLLLGLTLPPAFPLWMAMVGAVVSILLGKMIFGGLGFNPFNPALVGRVFLQAAFPVSITTWTTALSPDRFVSLPASTLTFPLAHPVADAVTGATPLAALKFEAVDTAVTDLFLGGVSGSSGETCAVVILLSGIYLGWRQMLDWRIPVGIFAAAAILSGILHIIDPAFPAPLFTLLSGGLMLGAVFMATDMVTSPMSGLAVWSYAVFIGVMVVVIRVWGGLPEGVMYVILLANALTPLLNRCFVPRTYGHGGNQ